MSKRPVFNPNPEPLPKLDSPDAIRETLNRMVGEIYSGSLDPKRAASLALFLNMQLRAVETCELEQARLRLDTRTESLRTAEEKNLGCRPQSVTEDCEQEKPDGIDDDSESRRHQAYGEDDG